MKLTSKIILMQAVVSTCIILLGLLFVPEVIYQKFKNSVRTEVSNYSAQIMSNISQELTENKREAGVLAEDDMLKQELLEYAKTPDSSHYADISLYLSRYFIRDQIPSYKAMGIYISYLDSEKETFHSVGLSQNIMNYLQDNVLSKLSEKDTDGMFISPFSYPYDSSTMWANKFNRVYGYVQEFKIGKRKAAVTVISLYDDISYLTRDMKHTANDYVLLDTNNTIIEKGTENSKIDIAYTLNHLKYGNSYQIGYLNEKDGFCSIVFSSIGNWKLICRLTRAEILQKNRSILRFSMVLIILFEIIANLATAVIVRRLLKPLSEVSRKMHEVAKGNMHVRIAYTSKDEVGDVVASFNSMTKKLDTYIQKLVQKEKVEQRLRYNILVSKIDPHFIYNTMNTITYLAEQKRPEDVVVVNKAMIEIMRDRLRIEPENVFDMIGQEIHVLKQYLSIQQYRFEHVFKSEIHVERGTEEFYIAKNMIQPIVENALLHGILTNKDEDGEMLGGCIYVSIYRENQMIQIVVHDNGSGMNSERLGELQRGDLQKERGRHVGLQNIRDRLKILYNGQAAMKIESVEGEGTTVTLSFPLMAENRTDL